MSHDLEYQMEYLTKGCVDVIPRDELESRLKESITSGEPMTIKVGFDPSAPDLHLGHTVVIRKMRHFQQMGHRVVFLIGDFTGLIGDPTGKKATRPQLSEAEIQANAETYRRQIFKLLDPEATVIDFNSRWLGALSSAEWIRLAAKVTVAQMLERDDFRKRYEAQKPIALHEFLYPLAQAYDSVMLKCDVELGGTDQLFNLLMGRHLMREQGLKPQIVMTLPLLEGLDGVEKMSKSLGNYIAVEDGPSEMFGKIMSISDELMWKYWLLLTDLLPAEVETLRKAVEGGEKHPMAVKKQLARRVITDFHDESAAEAAETEFERVFSSRKLPSEIPEKTVRCEGDGILLSKLLVETGLAPSNSQARRLITQNAVRLEGKVISDPKMVVPTGTDVEGLLLQCGKRGFARIRWARD